GGRYRTMLHFFNSISIFYRPVAKFPVRRSTAEVEAIGPRTDFAIQECKYTDQQRKFKSSSNLSP
ncbi:MAG: hypothetical protein ACK45H_00950, partial [Bacteroidota bacterium]